MSRADLQERLAEHSSSAFADSARAYGTTGGSTGIPVGFFEERGLSVAREHAFLDFVRSQFGATERNRHGVLGGSFVGDPARGRLLDRNPIWNELAISSYHLTDEFLPRMWSGISAFAPTYLEGYSSALDLLAQYAVRTGSRLPSLGVIFARSENLYPHQRERIGQAFGVPVVNWYGHAEKAVLAAECPSRNGYHVMPSYGHVELLRKDGTSIDSPGEVGEIVVTGFVNRATTFIRYRTADFASWAESGRCACGMDTPRLARIEGRLQELILSRQGRLISMVAINFHDRIFDEVRQFQFYQKEAGAVTLRLVPRPEFGAEHLAKIREGVARKLGADMDLSVELVDAIPAAPNGKHRFLIQMLPIAGSD